MISLGAGIRFDCSNGGTVQMIGTAADLHEVGLIDGWAFYDDFYLNPYVDMTLDVSGSYGVSGMVEHLTGDSIMSFNLSSREPNGRADVRIEGLKPEGWYRLQFYGSLVQTAGGQSHGQTTDSGIIEFMEVSIPNE